MSFLEKDLKSDSSAFEEEYERFICQDSKSLNETIRSVESAVREVKKVVNERLRNDSSQHLTFCDIASSTKSISSQGVRAMRLPHTSSFNPSKTSQMGSRHIRSYFDFKPMSSNDSPHPSPALCPSPPFSTIHPSPQTCTRKIPRSESWDNLKSSMTSPTHPGGMLYQSSSSFDISVHRMPVVFDKPYIAIGRKLLKAAEMGKTGLVRNLLDAGADPNFTFGTEWTPLHKAARKGHADVVSVLLLRGANPQARTTSGFTALHIAAYNDYCGKCVMLLIDAGSDVRSTNLSGRTPLHYAAESGNMAAVRKLLAAGANRFATNNAGQTPLDIASPECVRRLLR